MRCRTGKVDHAFRFAFMQAACQIPAYMGAHVNFLQGGKIQPICLPIPSHPSPSFPSFPFLFSPIRLSLPSLPRSGPLISVRGSGERCLWKKIFWRLIGAVLGSCARRFLLFRIYEVRGLAAIVDAGHSAASLPRLQ